jgi:ubiquitin carboxyl-terminal hydrolase 48
MYELTAVLVHRGQSAYSGHYIAHIKDRASGTWYKFNDEDVQHLSGKSLQLGAEEELISGKDKDKKTPKVPKGFHETKNAYMLVYRRQADNGSY